MGEVKTEKTDEFNRYLRALDELVVPATRYYLGRTSISTSQFPRYLRSVWDDLHVKDRAVLVYDIGRWLEETPTGTYGRSWWLELMEGVTP